MKNPHKNCLAVPLFFFFLCILQACSSDSSNDSSVIETERQSEFVSAGSESGGAYGPEATPAPSSYEDDTDAASREIEEADIIEFDGSNLYVLNRYKGLTIIDISNPDNPSISGRASIEGDPVEMYIREDRAYVIVSVEPVFGPEYDTSESSRVEIVDIANRADPIIAGSFDVTGRVSDSRIVGDILYVVSTENQYGPLTDTVPAERKRSDGPNTYIASLDVSDPANIRQTDREDFSGSSQYIHVTEKAIFVSSTMGYWRDDATTVTHVDISDPGGRIVTRGSIDIPGQVMDEYKMDCFNGYFRICSWEWQGEGVSNLFVIDTSDPDNMRRTGSVELGRGEQLFATRFDGDRAYMVTFEVIDPLWVIDLSDPANPAVRGELEVPGWSTHIEPRGDSLVALGVDDTDGWRVSVSLFDVSDPDRPALADRVSFGEQWSSSEAFNDVKSFTVVDDLGLILLPYTSSDYISGTYKSENRLQFIDFSDTDLTARGSVTQKGSVLRGRSYSNRVFSMSDDELQVIDASNRDNPQVTANLTLAEDLVDFIPLDNGYGVRVVRSDGNYFLESVPISNPEPGKATGEIAMDDYYTSAFTNGGMIYTVSNIYNTLYVEDVAVRHPYITRIRAYDFSSPARPVRRGSADIEGSYYDPMPLMENGVMCPYPYHSRTLIMQVKNDVFVFVAENPYYREDLSDVLRIVDFSNPDNPAPAVEHAIDEGTNFFTKNGIVYYSFSTDIESDGMGRPQTKYYLGRIDLADPSVPAELPPINIPGVCVGMDEAGDFAYTVDDEWGDANNREYSFKSVKIENDTALFYGEAELDEYYYEYVIADGIAYAAGGYYWYGDTGAGYAAIDLSDPENLRFYKNTVGNAYYTDIIGAKKRKLFLSVPSGIACFDMTNPDSPELEETIDRWADNISFSDDMAYLSLGYYGIWAKDL